MDGAGLESWCCAHGPLFWAVNLQTPAPEQPIIYILLGLLALPGLMLYYGGLVRAKNILATQLQVVVCFAIGLAAWLLVSPALMGLPASSHALLQESLLAAVALALLAGAVAERVPLGRSVLLAFSWLLVVYLPLQRCAAYLNLAQLDSLGGSWLHLAIAFTALSWCWRTQAPKSNAPLNPNSLRLSLFGAMLLHLGWLGLAASVADRLGLPVVAAVQNTLLAGWAGALAWIAIEAAEHRKPTALGFASGLVVGLAAIAPCTAQVSNIMAVIIGLAAGGLCSLADVGKKYLPLDDGLDVFLLHGVGGVVGIGFAWFTTGQMANWLMLMLGASAVAFLLGRMVWLALRRVISLEASEEERTLGLDLVLHGQAAFDFEPDLGGTGLIRSSEPRSAVAPPTVAKRYSLIVDGAEEPELRAVWSGLCQVRTETSPEFLAVYSHVTTVEGRVFRFRGGDPSTVRQQLERLLRDRLRTAAVRVRVHSDSLVAHAKAA